MDKVFFYIKLYKLEIGLGFFGALLIIIGSVLPLNQLIKGPALANQAPIIVDISGSVNNPGIYKLNQDETIGQGIKIAGGLTDQADPGYVQKNINLAAPLKNGDKVYIASVNDVKQNQESKLINVNTATQTELESLAGIGPTTALKIIQNRPFNTAADLVTKKAVGKSTFNKIKNQISVY